MRCKKDGTRYEVTWRTIYPGCLKLDCSSRTNGAYVAAITVCNNRLFNTTFNYPTTLIPDANIAFLTYGYTEFADDIIGETFSVYLTEDDIIVLGGWVAEGEVLWPAAIKLTEDGEYISTTLYNDPFEHGLSFNSYSSLLTRQVSQTNGPHFIIGGYTNADPPVALARYVEATGELEADGWNEMFTTWFNYGGYIPNKIITQSDDSLLLVGPALESEMTGTGIIKVTALGVQDDAFGNSGELFIPLLYTYNYVLSAITELSNGNILVGGKTDVDGPDAFGISIIDQVGESISEDYIIPISLTDVSDYVNGITAVTSFSGGAYISGLSYNSETSLESICLLKIDNLGEIDIDFGVSGLATFSFEGVEGNVTEILIDEDDKIIVTGYMAEIPVNETQEFGGDSYSLFAVRFHTDGSVDTTYGVEGMAKSWIGAEAFSYGSAMQSNGKIVMSGYTHDQNWNWSPLALRYRTDGSLDQKVPTSTIFDISEELDLLAILAQGESLEGAGMDGINVFNGDEISASQTFREIDFTLVTTGSANAIQALGQTLEISGSFDDLYIVASTGDGPFEDGGLTVNYSDDSSVEFTQRHFSDWTNANPYNNEFLLLTTQFRNTLAGEQEEEHTNMYVYKFPVDRDKTITSIVLPNPGAPATPGPFLAIFAITGVVWD